jgi:hypothetical protein
MLLPLATVLGLTGCSYVLSPAVSERHALPATVDDVYCFTENTQIMRIQRFRRPGTGRPALLAHCKPRDYRLWRVKHKRREIPLYSTILEYL